MKATSNSPSMEPSGKKNCILLLTICLSVLILFVISVTVLLVDKDFEYESEMFTTPSGDNFEEHIRMFPTSSSSQPEFSTKKEETTKSTEISTTARKTTNYKPPNTPWHGLTSPTPAPGTTTPKSSTAEPYVPPVMEGTDLMTGNYHRNR